MNNRAKGHGTNGLNGHRMTRPRFTCRPQWASLHVLILRLPPDNWQYYHAVGCDRCTTRSSIRCNRLISAQYNQEWCLSCQTKRDGRTRSKMPSFVRESELVAAASDHTGHNINRTVF